MRDSVGEYSLLHTSHIVGRQVERVSVQMSTVITWEDCCIDRRCRSFDLFESDPSVLQSLVRELHKKPLLGIDSCGLRFRESEKGVVKIAYITRYEMTSGMVRGTVQIICIWMKEGLTEMSFADNPK